MVAGKLKAKRQVTTQMIICLILDNDHLTEDRTNGKNVRLEKKRKGTDKISHKR